MTPVTPGGNANAPAAHRLRATPSICAHAVPTCGSIATLYECDRHVGQLAQIALQRTWSPSLTGVEEIGPLRRPSNCGGRDLVLRR